METISSSIGKILVTLILMVTGVTTVILCTFQEVTISMIPDNYIFAPVAMVLIAVLFAFLGIVSHLSDMETIAGSISDLFSGLFRILNK